MSFFTFNSILARLLSFLRTGIWEIDPYSMATCKALLKCEAKPEENDIGTKRIERVYCG